MLIPKIIHQVWIGPLPAPTEWMKTWPEINPSWEYRVWDNDAVFSRKWRTQRLIDIYLQRYHNAVKGTGGRVDRFISARGNVFTGEKATLFAWHVIADLIRYEILHEYGGYMPGADTVCLKPIDEIFLPDTRIYTVRTGHLYKAQYARIRHLPSNARNALHRRRYHPSNASPILASVPGHEFLDRVISELSSLRPDQLGEAVDTTGNVFMGRMLTRHPPDGLQMPDYVLMKNRTPDTHHSIHYSGTTKGSYAAGRDTIEA